MCIRDRAIGAGIGAIYGAIIAYTKIPPFIATLGAQLICRASAKMYTSRPVSNLTGTEPILAEPRKRNSEVRLETGRLVYKMCIRDRPCTQHAWDEKRC